MPASSQHLHPPTLRDLCAPAVPRELHCHHSVKTQGKIATCTCTALKLHFHPVFARVTPLLLPVSGSCGSIWSMSGSEVLSVVGYVSDGGLLGLLPMEPPTGEGRHRKHHAAVSAVAVDEDQLWLLSAREIPGNGGLYVNPNLTGKATRGLGCRAADSMKHAVCHRPASCRVWGCGGILHHCRGWGYSGLAMAHRVFLLLAKKAKRACRYCRVIFAHLAPASTPGQPLCAGAAVARRSVGQSLEAAAWLQVMGCKQCSQLPAPDPTAATSC